MREVKFRAWDKAHKRMVQIRTMYFSNPREYGVLTDVYKAGYRLTENNLILMQYTGLKDGTDKKAYQHDKLYFKGKIWGMIEYNKLTGGWMATSLRKGSTGNYLTQLSQILMDSMVIIGNIHANPEPLEV